jgi:preprotein translocase subunit SecG
VNGVPARGNDTALKSDSLVERNLNRWTIGFAIALGVNTIILLKI